MAGASASPVEEVAARLYALPLEDFTRERDAAARELRRAKDRDAAAVVAKLPKPSQAAWAANAVAREHPELLGALLEAGQALRDGQEAALAGGGADALRSATAAERAAVDAFVAAAAELTPGGRAPSAVTLDRLRDTLHGAARDDGTRAALEAARVVEDAPSGAQWGELLGEVPARAPKAAAKAGAAGAEPESAAPKRDREAERRAKEEARAKAEALKAARAARRERERGLEVAERDAGRAVERVQAAEVELAEAREADAAARVAVQEAEAALAEAEDAVGAITAA